MDDGCALLLPDTCRADDSDGGDEMGDDDEEEGEAAVGAVDCWRAGGEPGGALTVDEALLAVPGRLSSLLPFSLLASVPVQPAPPSAALPLMSAWLTSCDEGDGSDCA